MKMGGVFQTTSGGGTTMKAPKIDLNPPWVNINL
jgi:hypothetical protein